MIEARSVIDLSYPPDVAMALFVSIFAGLLAIYVLVKTGGEHECGNRFCPHARRVDDETVRPGPRRRS